MAIGNIIPITFVLNITTAKVESIILIGNKMNKSTNRIKQFTFGITDLFNNTVLNLMLIST
ncbi:MAG: hypothetical protein ACTS8R_00395 [Arsenophonus sp. NC-QC1-MAG3]